jgi:uncharacterized Tic20 family protein
MFELSITTPALLFSAVSLILLAYTNRFLAYASVVRNLYAEYKKNKDYLIVGQIKNLKKRLNLIRWMQLSGVLSLFLSMASTLLIYLDCTFWGSVSFLAALLFMIFSLALSMWEIQISVVALDLHIKDMEKYKK